MLSLSAGCTCCYQIGTETMFAICLDYLSFRVFMFTFCTFVRVLCIKRYKYWYFMCFEVCMVEFIWPAHHSATNMTALLQNATHCLNYQPYNFTVFIICFLTVCQSSKCIQISKVHLQMIKKYAWFGLLIQSKYRSWFSHNKAIILPFLANVWVLTGLPQLWHRDLQGDGSFLLSVENRGCRWCFGFHSGVEAACLAAAAGKGSLFSPLLSILCLLSVFYLPCASSRTHETFPWVDLTY